MLLNNLHHTGQPPAVIWPQMATVLRLRDPGYRPGSVSAWWTLEARLDSKHHEARHRICPAHSREHKACHRVHGYIFTELL